MIVLLLLKIILYFKCCESSRLPYNTSFNCTTFTLSCPVNDSSFICYSFSNNHATCNVVPNSILLCRNGQVVILDSYCLIFDPNRTVAYAGQCLYGQSKVKLEDGIYKNIPTELKCQETMKRSGILCGECEADHYPLAYSYNLTCVPCPHGHYNWLKVLPALLIPITIFCILVIVLKVKVLSSHLHGFVFYSQAISSPAFGRVIFNHPYIAHNRFFFIIKSLGSFYSIWNLDIFRFFSPGICLPIESRDILWIDLAVGTYPLIMIAMTYFAIQLYYNNIPVFVCLWNFTRRVFTKSWGINSTLIDAFSTFLVLSSVKILSAMLDLLASTQVYELSQNSSVSKKWRLYYDPEVRFFKGSYHINFYISILVVFIFIALPFIILVLYPFRFFQKCLNQTCRNWNALHIFMDTFQGCYKNGTDHGSHDFRWFSAVFFGSRVILALLYILTYNSMYFVLAAITVVLIVLLLILFQPFRPEVSMYSYSTSMFLLLLSLWYVSLSSFDLTSSGKKESVAYCFYIVAVIVTVMPAIYFGFIVVKKIRCSQLFCKR